MTHPRMWSTVSPQAQLNCLSSFDCTNLSSASLETEQMTEPHGGTEEGSGSWGHTVGLLGTPVPLQARLSPASLTGTQETRLRKGLRWR